MTDRRKEIEEACFNEMEKCEWLNSSDEHLAFQIGFEKAAGWADSHPEDTARADLVEALKEIGHAQGRGVEASVFTLREIARAALAKLEANK